VKATEFYGRLRKIYSMPYILLNLVILLVYYVVVEKIVALQQFGLIFITAPAYLIILLVVSSSILMTIAAYTIVQSRKAKNLGYGGAVGSCATAVVGGVMSGCGCQGAILYSALAIVAGSGEAFSINTVFSEHIGLILGALVIFNIAFIVYSLGRFDRGRRR
jgi:hypothetical protein